MNAKISVFVIYAETIIYLLLYNFHDCIFKQTSKRNVMNRVGDDFVGIGRSSRPEVLFKKCALENFAKFTGKHLRQRLFLIKFRTGPCNFIKKRLWHRCFLVNLQNFQEHLFFNRTPPVAASV